MPSSQDDNVRQESDHAHEKGGDDSRDISSMQKLSPLNDGNVKQQSECEDEKDEDGRDNPKDDECVQENNHEHGNGKNGSEHRPPLKDDNTNQQSDSEHGKGQDHSLATDLGENLPPSKDDAKQENDQKHKNAEADMVAKALRKSAASSWKPSVRGPFFLYQDIPAGFDGEFDAGRRYSSRYWVIDDRTGTMRRRYEDRTETNSSEDEDYKAVQKFVRHGNPYNRLFHKLYQREWIRMNVRVWMTKMFISSRGNEYFCEIDEDYLTDRFNLTGLNTEVQYYQYALDLVTDVFDLDCDDEMRETIEKSARHLYGLVHARYIVTTRGLSKMLEKYKKADFGKCPRVMCKSHPLLPMGQADNPNVKAVKLYCARCEDIYNPKSSRHSAIDGAYFGTSFHNIIFQVYPALIPQKSIDRYIPRIYGFKVHAPATLIRWQNAERDDMRKRLRKLEVESGFKDDEGDVDPEDSEEEEEDDDVDVEAIENGEMEGREIQI